MCYIHLDWYIHLFNVYNVNIDQWECKKDRRWSSFLELSFYINSNSLDIYKAKLLQENVFFMQGNVRGKKPDSPKFKVWYSYDHLWEIPICYYQSLINYLHVHMYWLVSNKDKRLTKLRYTYMYHFKICYVCQEYDDSLAAKDMYIRVYICINK